MCTVSFVSAGNKKIITSNRDEHIGRQTAYAPVIETINGQPILFPKDARAGGTWFAASAEAVVAVLLNGAFVKHVPQQPYRKSRGLVLLDIITAHQPFVFIEEVSLEGIEPFTLVLHQFDRLTELRWDGNNKHTRELDANGHYIWSSATLYTDEVITHRKKLFEEFIRLKPIPTPGAVQEFHSDDHRDEENGFVINRNTGMKTFSITQAEIGQEQIIFRHTDLLQHQQFEETMKLRREPVNL